MYIQDRLNSFLRPDIHDYFNPTTIKKTVVSLHQMGPTPPRLKAVGT